MTGRIKCALCALFGQIPKTFYNSLLMGSLCKQGQKCAKCAIYACQTHFRHSHQCISGFMQRQSVKHRGNTP